MERDTVFVRDPYRQSGGYFVSGGPDVKGSGFDCGGGYQAQY